MAESRSSRSETAALKDFVLGAFPLCSASAATIIHAGSNDDPTPHTVIAEYSSVAVVGDTIHDSVLITGEILGSGTAPDPGVDVDPQVTNVTFTLYDNDECTGNELQTSPGTLTGNTDGTSSAESANFVLTLTGGHSYKASWDGDKNYPDGATSDCEPFYVIQPKLKIDKLVNACWGTLTDYPETFDLLYGPNGGALSLAPNGANKQHGGSTGFFGVYPGTYDVDESTHVEYVRRFQPSGFCAGGTVTLSGNLQRTCTIENIRKPHLIIQKRIVPATDPGQFNLQINDVTVDNTYAEINSSYFSGDGSNVGDGAAVEIRVDGIPDGNPVAGFGSFTFGETAGTGTVLANYQTSILCDDISTTQAVFGTGGGSTRKTAAIPVAAGQVVTCTITNIRKVTANDCPDPSP